MEAFVETAFDDEARWNALYFGIVLNCSAPILAALLFSAHADTRLKPGPSPTKPYHNTAFLAFLRTLFISRLCLKYPNAQTAVQDDVFYMFNFNPSLLRNGKSLTV